MVRVELKSKNDDKTKKGTSLRERKVRVLFAFSRYVYASISSEKKKVPTVHPTTEISGTNPCAIPPTT